MQGWTSFKQLPRGPDLFGCECAQYQRDNPCMMGACGHGLAWMELALAVRRVAREQFDRVLALDCDEDEPQARGFREGLH